MLVLKVILMLLLPEIFFLLSATQVVYSKIDLHIFCHKKLLSRSHEQSNVN